MPQQSEWRYCQKCHAMFYDGFGNKGRCQAGGAHVAQGLNFTLLYGDQNVGAAQTSWRFCDKCYVMFYDGYGDKGSCATAGGHSAQGIVFSLTHSVPGSATAQNNWRYCQKCHAMFYDGYGNKGACSAGGGHLAQGLNFVLSHTGAVGYVGGTRPATGKVDIGGAILTLTPDIVVDRFCSAMLKGAEDQIPPTYLVDLEAKLAADPQGFQIGYAKGVLRGLLAGLQNLWKTVVTLFELGINWSPPAIVFQLTREAAKLLSSKMHRELRKRQLDEAKAIAGLVSDTIADIAVRPSDYVVLSDSVGGALGKQAGLWFAEDFLKRSAPEIGEAVGSVVGQVLFEIIVQLLLIAFTEGVGNAARGGVAVGEATGMAIGEASATGGRISRLGGAIIEALERAPGLRRLMRILSEMRAGLALADAEAVELAEEVERAFGEGAILQRGATGGFPLLEKLPELTAAERAAAGKLLGQEFSPALRAAWGNCSNPQAVQELAEVQRLLNTGSVADREAAYNLSERTYGNWRDRFWNRVRGDQGLRKIFEDAGASFDKSGAPYYKMGGKKTKNLTVTLDHFIERRVDNPARAVDALNVRPSLGFENSATLEAIRRDNFLKGWASP
jgi:hypothetical protein